MRRHDREVTDPAWCRRVLDDAPFLVLALNDRGAPYTVPLCCAVHEDAVYLHMATEGRKLDLLRRDPLVGFTAVAEAAVVSGPTPCAFGMRYRSVSGTARCILVEVLEERCRALDALSRKYAWSAPDGYPEDVLSATVVIRLEWDTLTGKRSG
jgi:nitroimidazol reductase NimA-like FMN-containing flavoprotein (pyridoxamine 5'-phosphate oxidase superfamily)